MKNVNIIIRTSQYGTNDKITREVDKYGRIWIGTRREAVKRIADLQVKKHILAHNEHGIPKYTITYNLMTN